MSESARDVDIILNAYKAQAGGGGLTFTMFCDIDARPRKDWLVRDMLGAGDLSCLFGAPSSGKSVLASDLAGHIAAGRPWFGRAVVKGGVLYVAAERAALVRRRFAAFRIYHDLESLPLAVVSGSVDLRSSRTSADAIVENADRLQQMTGLPLALVIIDTVSRALCGGDENSPKDMGALVGNLAHIQDATAAHLLTVHHIPAGGEQRMRGHSLFLGACDTTAAVEKATACRTCTTHKSNDGPEGERIAFALQSVDLDPATGTTAPVVLPVEGAPAQAAKVPTRPLSKAAQIAIRALREAVTDLGTVPPTSNRIPASVRVVTIEQWRLYAYKGGISAADTTDRARQQAFKRAADYLIANQLVGTWNDKFWPT